MSPLYHLMIPQPGQPILDAVVQEVASLQAQFGGEAVYLNPARRPGSLYPERFYGLHRLPYLRRQEAMVRLHHVYNAHPLFFPYLRWLRRPIIYSVTAGLKPSMKHSHLKGLERPSAIVVSSERDQTTLRKWGLENVHVIRPGIDTSRFRSVAPPTGPGFALLAGSAPWTEAQFRSKGVEALLAAAEVRPDLRLVFLWRDMFFETMQTRVAQCGLQRRVEVINRWVDVNEVLARVHAAVVLAADTTLVKAFASAMGIYPIGTVLRLNTGEVGIVVRRSQLSGEPDRAMIRVIADRRGTQTTEEQFIDLGEVDPDTGRFIYSAVDTLSCQDLGVDPRDYLLS